MSVFSFSCFQCGITVQVRSCIVNACQKSRNMHIVIILLCDCPFMRGVLNKNKKLTKCLMGASFMFLCGDVSSEIYFFSKADNIVPWMCFPNPKPTSNIRFSADYGWQN